MQEVPGKPENLNISFSDENKFTMTWDQPAPGAQSYNLVLFYWKSDTENSLARVLGIKERKLVYYVNNYFLEDSETS